MSFWTRISHRPGLTLSFSYLAILALMTLFATQVTPYSYEAQNISERLQSPTFSHWMGTDSLGRDLFSRVVFGGRMSLSVGMITALLSMTLGTFFGSIAGYFGGKVDHLLMRIAELFAIFPSPLLAILLSLLFGRGLLGILIAIGITAWITQARFVRGQILQMRELPYIEAARALGAKSFQIIVHHILPNIWGPILVSLFIQIPTSMMTESFLSFIGLGLQPPLSSWGTLANEGFRFMKSHPHLILFPSGVLFITMLALNYLGEGLRKLNGGKNEDGR